MTQYAESTSVSAEKSRNEIERTLQRYGASSFAYGWEEERALVQFTMNDRRIRFVIEMPNADDDQFKLTAERKRKRTEAQAYAAWEQATRQRWRALALVIKAKLEAVESGITEFDNEFLAHIVLPNGQSAGDWIRPSIDEAYANNKMPSALPALGAG